MSTLLPPSRDEDGGEARLTTEPLLSSEVVSGPAAPDVSFDAPPSFSDFGAAPRLSMLGKKIEMLRVDRGLSKQALARSSGTSRQQLWRVMTGKADLTGSLGQRLATVLDVDSRTLSTASLGGDAEVPLAGVMPWPTSPASLAEYLASPGLLTRSLSSLPAGDDGVALRTALLNAVEERARLRGLRIPDWLLQLRGSVLNGDL